MSKKHILDRMVYHLRLAKGASGKTFEETAAAIGVAAGSTIGRNLDNPGSMQVNRVLDLCEVWGTSAADVLTKAIEDAQLGRGA